MKFFLLSSHSLLNSSRFVSTDYLKVFVAFDKIADDSSKPSLNFFHSSSKLASVSASSGVKSAKTASFSVFLMNANFLLIGSFLASYSGSLY